MKRWRMIFVVLVLAVAACAGPEPTQEEPGRSTTPDANPVEQSADKQQASVGDQEGTAPGSTGTEGAPVGSRIALTGEVTEWTGTDAQGKEPLFEAQSGACQPDGSGLIAELRAAQWRPNAGSDGDFYGPTATFVLCNAGNVPLLAHDVTATFTQGEVQLRLPQLNPGEGVGPIRFHSSAIVPTGTITYWAEDGRRWPTFRVKLTAGTALLAEGELTHGIGDAHIVVASESELTVLPVAPGLNDLRRLAFAYERIRHGSGVVELFLYAPDMMYERSKVDDCSTSPGSVEAGGGQWAFWVSADGSEPVAALLLGGKHFAGGRSLRVEYVPSQELTLLMLERYLSCANPMVYDIYAYDHRRGDVFRPQMKVQDGQVVDAGAARVEVLSDAGLVSRIYQNYGLIGTHTYVYRWDTAERMWVFESHEHSA